MEPIQPKERAKLAELIGVDDQYLYQCLTQRRDMDAGRAREAEEKTDGRLRRWMLTRSWHRIWPELIGADGAPPIPEPEAAEVAKAV